MDEKGKQIGLFSKDEAIRKAWEMGLDLVEISGSAKPPVAKIIDFKKFKYLESKKEQEIKKKTKDVQTKEIRLGPFTGVHDLQIKIKQAEGFLKEGNRIKLVIKFQGRELSRKEFGYNLSKKFSETISLLAKQEMLPKWEGKLLVSFFTPANKQSFSANKTNAKDEN